MKKIIDSLDKWLLICSLILFVIGIIMVFSASNVTSFVKYQASPYRFFEKQLLFLIISFLLAIIVVRFSTKTYCAVSWILLWVIIGLLSFLLIYGQVQNQAISWIPLLGSFTIQPSEFGKIVFIIWMASYYTMNKDASEKLGFNIFPLVMAGVNIILIMAQPDLGTAAIFLGIVLFIFISLPITKKAKGKCLLVILGLFFIFSMLLLNNGIKLILQRQLARLDFADPCSTEKFFSSGNQVCNGYIAINNGGLFGKGLGNSTQKYLYLPEAYTDFIFAIVMEELGLIISVVILILYFIILWRIYLIAKKSYTDRGAIICYGIFLFILFHIVINLGGLFGLIPLTGVPLPFLSYGGSFTMCLVISLAIVQRVNYETREKLLKKMKKG